MNIPSLINIGILNFPTHYLLYFLLAVLTLFAIWFESIRDGFDRERVFDLFFMSLGLFIGLFYFLKYLSFYDYFVEKNLGFILIATFSGLTLLGFRCLTFKWKWSVYRFLDIFSIMYFVMAAVLFFNKAYTTKGSNLYIYLVLFGLGYFATLLSRNKLFSGAVFSIFLLLVAIFGQFFFQQKQYLIFYFALITISMVNLVFRSKKNMSRKKLNFEFLSKIRGLLLSKDKRLKVEQKKLIEEDPYLKEGRDTDNAEIIDEAILEDRAKVEIDIKKENIGSMQDQVGKALGKLEKGDYGICEVCGEAIDKARLEVYPEATKCVKCAGRESE